MHFKEVAPRSWRKNQENILVIMLSRAFYKDLHASQRGEELI
jgi:hypothetical protein